jgi:hypothetical protein
MIDACLELDYDFTNKSSPTLAPQIKIASLISLRKGKVFLA